LSVLFSNGRLNSRSNCPPMVAPTVASMSHMCRLAFSVRPVPVFIAKFHLRKYSAPLSYPYSLRRNTNIRIDDNRSLIRSPCMFFIKVPNFLLFLFSAVFSHLTSVNLFRPNRLKIANNLDNFARPIMFAHIFFEQRDLLVALNLCWLVKMEFT
jgi:hypothetical protein